MKLWELLDNIGERRAAARKIRAARAPNLRMLANVIGCSVVFGFLGALFALFVIPIPPQNEQVITYMIGQLSGFAGGILAYHYTSKAGEKELDAKRADNTAALTDLAKKALEASPGAQGNGNGGPGPEEGADRVAGAAEEEADRVRRESESQ